MTWTSMCFPSNVFVAKIYEHPIIAVDFDQPITMHLLIKVHILQLSKITPAQDIITLDVN